jgi:hypothetical protein
MIMKKIKVISLILIGASLLASCSEGERVSGSPVGVIPIETVTGSVSTDANFALPGQVIKFTATLPAGFRNIVKDTVTIEASTFTTGGGIRRASVDILPGQESETGEITVGGGGGTFDLNCDLRLTAINLKKVVPGKHYLITSNTVSIASGNSSVPPENDSRLQIRVSWENKTAQNILRPKIVRTTGAENFFPAGVEPGFSKTYPISNSQLVNANGNPIAEGAQYSYLPGTYKVKLGVNSNSDLAVSPVDMKYRITIRFPNKDVQIINGVYNGLSGTSGYKDILQFTKVGTGSASQYTDFVNLNP